MQRSLVSGGVSAEFQGGKFQDGFLSVGSASLLSPGIDTFDTRPGRIVAASTISGTVAELGGGKFANGAATAAYLQSSIEAADYFRSKVGGRATLKPGENRPNQTTYRYDPKTGQHFPQDWSMNVVGHNSTTGICRQGDLCSRALNLVPGMNGAVARTHDYWLNSRKAAGLNVTQLHNVGTMLPAAAVGYSAIVGQVFQPLTSQQLVDLSAASSFGRNNDQRSIYGAAAIGAR